MGGRKYKIGINALFIQPGRNRGVETFLTKLVQALDELQKNNQYVVFCSRGNEKIFRQSESIETVVCIEDNTNRLKRFLFEQVFLRKLAEQHELDAMLFPGYLGWVLPNIPQFVVIHDTQFRDVPYTLRWDSRLIYNLVVPRSARVATKVFTVSNFSKQRIMTNLGLSEDQIKVVYEGPLNDGSAKVEEFNLTDYGIHSPYLFTVSSGLRHKNLGRLVDGFHAFNEQHKKKYQLVIAGEDGQADTFGEVVYLGYIPNDLRDYLYKESQAFIFASLYEGFGLPVLEAMQMEIPVVCSSAASLPEVGGEACLYFNPLKVEDIQQKLTQLMSDPALRQEMVRRGRERIKLFSWEQCAREIDGVMTAELGTVSAGK